MNYKLSPRFYGPYEITEKIGTVAYRLALPEVGKIHPVFHISLLKKKIRDQAVKVVELPTANPSQVTEFYLEEILQTKDLLKRRGKVILWLIKWKNRSIKESTWESTEEILKKFRNFEPWGQGYGKGEGCHVDQPINLEGPTDLLKEWVGRGKEKEPEAFELNCAVLLHLFHLLYYVLYFFFKCTF